MDEAAWVWLQKGVGYCNHGVNYLLEDGKHPSELVGMSAKALTALDYLTPKQVAALCSTKPDYAQQVLDECGQKGYAVLTPDHDSYPIRLKNIPMMPAVLYVEGKLDMPEEVPSLAMVGTRQMSEYGCRVAYQLSTELSRTGFIVVSGLALGIDAQCHKGAVKAEGTTVAVLGCGLNLSYPEANRELREMILQNGAVVSEFIPKTPPLPHNFPIRNRIIAGLSLGVLVVEGSLKSGSLITAGQALAQGRDVFAVPSHIYDPHGRGCLRLIQQGAKLVTCAKDVVEEYLYLFKDKIIMQALAEQENPKYLPKEFTVALPIAEPQKPKNPRRAKEMLKEEPKNSKKAPPAYLTEVQRLVYAQIDTHLLTAQQVIQQTDRSFGEIFSALTELEIYGLIRSHAGGRYSI